MNNKIKLALVLFIIGLTLTVGGAVLRILQQNGSNSLMISGLIAHFSGAGLMVGNMITTRKLG